ncbi:ankyrin repeat domain-containing protein [Legionella sp. CNM-4043-24]|uniref:ankyrin repeat domain-containing protein n=1 Tax=Legionella sp. CNM-4043-24 TaxID=3421646 RepID=UPI00403AF13B
MQIEDLSTTSINKLTAAGFKPHQSIERERICGGYIYSDFFTPLTYAIYHNDFDLVQDLVEHGVDINKICPRGFTPLMRAAEQGRDVIADYLLQAGADDSCKVTYMGKNRDAYSISKKMNKVPLCSLLGLWQTAKKILGTANTDRTTEILKPKSP